MRNEKHAVYATTVDRRGERQTFRVGQPVKWDTAIARWTRLDSARLGGKKPAVRANRRQYRVEFYEVRAVDRHGRGLGSERHGIAHPVPYRTVKTR